MNPLNAFLNVLLISFGLLVPVNGLAVDTGSVKFCTTWYSQFVDSGSGEDYYTSKSYEDRPAKYAHYQLRIQSNNNLVKYGILDSSGCTEYIPNLVEGTKYKFRQATKLERTGNRRIYIEFENAPWGPYYLWLNSYHTVAAPVGGSGWSYRYDFKPKWVDPRANVAVVASRALAYYSTREYPASTWTYIRPEDWPTSETVGENIKIDTRWTVLENTALYGEDHSHYKFIIGHELGHRQAIATGGPMGGSDIYTSEVIKCNCSHYPPGVGMCIQSQEYIGIAEKEAWAYFYAAALFNARETNCGIGFPGYLYTGSTPQTATLDTNPPVAANCAANSRWMENLIPDPDSHTGVLQDWLGFYWNLWTNGTYRYSIDEMTNIWKDTFEWGDWGELWFYLRMTVGETYGFESDKYDQFVDTGATAGVDY